MARSVGTRTSRKRSGPQYVRSILGQVWRHPSNRGRRPIAVARAVGWQVFKRVTGRPVTVSFGPYEIICHPDSGSSTNVIYFTERFDPVEQRFLDRYLRPGDRVVDVGANVGLYSLWAAKCTAPDGQVVAYEAAPRTAGRLVENIERNGLAERILARQKAVSDREGTVSFTADLDVSNRLVGDGEAARDGRGYVDVPAVRLDSDLPPGAFALGKVDVEGAETLAIRGWSDRLVQADPPVLLLEVLPGQLERLGSSAEELTELLVSLGYVFADFDGDELRVRSTTEGIRGNVFAVHGSALEMVQERLTARR